MRCVRRELGGYVSEFVVFFVYALRVDPVVRGRILKAEKLRCVRIARRYARARKVKSKRIALLDAKRLSQARSSRYLIR